MFKFFIPAFAALSLATTAQAEEFDHGSVIVPYADLDLSTDAGAATLHIDAAVKTVCARPSNRELKAIAEWQKCRVTALRSAAGRVAEANIPVTLVADSR